MATSKLKMDSCTVVSSKGKQIHDHGRLAYSQIDVHPKGNAIYDEALCLEAVITMMRELQLPKREMKKFGGDVMEFRKFIHQFKTRVEDNTQDDDERILLLEQYTIGEAKMVVEIYTHVDAKYGYPAAMKDLEERYGSRDVIAHAWIKKALDWETVQRDNAKALREFSVFLGECENELKSIDALELMGYLEYMRRLIAKLPMKLYYSWMSVVRKHREAGSTIKFTHLVSFVKDEAAIINDCIFGTDVMKRHAKSDHPIAMKELEQQYGIIHMIAYTYIMKALNWPKVKKNDAKALDKFAISLMGCRNAVTDMEAMKILESPGTLRCLVRKLPYYLHDRWRLVVWECKNEGKTIRFTNLVSFVKYEAEGANHPFYGIEALKEAYLEEANVKLNAQKSRQNLKKGSSVMKNDSEGKKTRKQDMKGKSRKKAFGKPCCYCQDSHHSLESCQRLERKPVTERLEFLKSWGICFGCLKSGHMKKDCRRRVTCSHCHKKHPTVLHEN
ncbi:uncharacterized protein LOC144451421 [Glandiceps talaboti]